MVPLREAVNDSIFQLLLGHRSLLHHEAPREVKLLSVPRFENHRCGHGPKRNVINGFGFDVSFWVARTNLRNNKPNVVTTLSLIFLRRHFGGF